MSYYDTLYLVTGDTKPHINFTIRDSNNAVLGMNLDPDDMSTWDPIDITDPIVRVKFRALGNTTLLDTMTCVKIIPYESGTCFMP